MKTKDKNTVTETQVIDDVDRWPAGIRISDGKDTTVSVADNMAVILTAKAFEQLFGWVYSTSREISCLGSVLQEGSVFIIERFYLLKQSCSSVNTELDQAAVAELMESLINDGKKQEAQKIKCWAHSHPDMDTFWSHTDDATCKLLVNNYLVSIVVAGNFQVRCRLDIATPVPVVFDNIPVYYQLSRNSELSEKFARQVKDSVKYAPKRIGTKAQTLVDTEEEHYCVYCGNWHAIGDCPLADMANMPDMYDESEFMF